MHVSSLLLDSLVQNRAESFRKVEVVDLGGDLRFAACCRQLTDVDYRFVALACPAKTDHVRFCWVQVLGFEAEGAF